MLCNAMKLALVVCSVLVLSGTGVQVNAAIDDFESYSTASTGNLVGQAADIGSGNWLGMEGDTSRLPSNDISISAQAGIGFSGQGAKSDDVNTHRAAAFDLGSSLTTGDSVSILMQFDSFANGPEAHLWVGNSSLTNGTQNDEEAFMIRVDASNGSAYNINADLFDGDGNESNVGNSDAFADYSDWVEVKINITGAAGNGITDGTAEWRNETDGDASFSSLGTFSYATGLGTGNTFIGLGTFANGGNFDDLNVTVVPEPTSLALMGLGVAFLFFVRRKS